MICILWRFKVRVEKVAEFELAYSPDGLWAELFRRDPAFRETRLLRDLAHERTYLTMDVWSDRSSYENFKRAHHEEYERVDRMCEALTEEETAIGIFEDLSHA